MPLTEQQALTWLSSIGPITVSISRHRAQEVTDPDNLPPLDRVKIVIKAHDPASGFQQTDGTGASLLDAIESAKDEADTMGFDAGLDPERRFVRPDRPRRTPRIGHRELFTPIRKGE